MKHEFLVDENFILYAFRYALGRSTYAVSDVAEFIIRNKMFLQPYIKKQIVQEIKEYFSRIHNNGLYMQCDKDCWDNVLKELEE